MPGSSDSQLPTMNSAHSAWLAKLMAMTDAGCPSAHARYTRRLSASTTPPRAGAPRGTGKLIPRPLAFAGVAQMHPGLVNEGVADGLALIPRLATEASIRRVRV